MIRVGVIGACGRMGLMVCRAITEADDLRLVAAIDRSRIGQRVGALIGHPEVDVPVSDELDRLLEAEVEVAIDFTHPDVVMDDVRWCVNHAIHLVVGTTGITQEDLQEIERAIGDEGAESNVIVASNFALGAVLMLRFASQAVRFFPAVEVVELHHDVRMGEVDGDLDLSFEEPVELVRDGGVDLGAADQWPDLLPDLRAVDRGDERHVLGVGDRPADHQAHAAAGADDADADHARAPLPENGPSTVVVMGCESTRSAARRTSSGVTAWIRASSWFIVSVSP